MSSTKMPAITITVYDGAMVMHFDAENKAPSSPPLGHHRYAAMINLYEYADQKRAAECAFAVLLRSARMTFRVLQGEFEGVDWEKRWPSPDPQLFCAVVPGQAPPKLKDE